MSDDADEREREWGGWRPDESPEWANQTRAGRGGVWTYQRMRPHVCAYCQAVRVCTRLWMYPDAPSHDPYVCRACYTERWAPLAGFVGAAVRA